MIRFSEVVADWLEADNCPLEIRDSALKLKAYIRQQVKAGRSKEGVVKHFQATIKRKRAERQEKERKGWARLMQMFREEQVK